MDRDTLVRAGFGVGTALGLLAMFHLVQRVMTPKHTLSSDMRGKNVAYQIVQVGHVLAVLLLVPGVVKSALASDTLAMSAAWAAAFAAAGLLLIQLVGAVGVRTLLRSTLGQELERGNVAAGVAAGSSYVGVGLVASRAIAGNDLHGLGLSIAFFGLSIATLGVFVALFRALTTYDDAEQIQGENLAAAISYAGITVAVAILVGRAVDGEFEGWRTSLLGYGAVVACAAALYPVRQIVVQGLILGRAPTLRGGSLDDAIGKDRNRGMAVMEAITYIATAVAIAELA